MTTSDAAHEFGALNTLLLVVILGLCILSAYLIKQNQVYLLPESAAAIVVGIIVGGLARLVYPSTEELNFLSFEPQMFFFLLLPPIIFEAGYSLRKREFFSNFWSISLYAVFGTIISTFIIGYLVYFMAILGIVPIDTSSPLEGLLFGALISAVDPVATLSIMGNPELNCDRLLYSLVFGESVLNDAVAIAFFKTFMAFYDSGEVFSTSTLPDVMVQFTIISVGSVIVGVLTGLMCSYLCKHTQMKKYPEYEISILFLFAYGSYSFAEAVELSGIMSLFFCGVVLSHYNSYNLSRTSQETAHNIFKSLAVLSEYFVFLYIGMGLFTGKFKDLHITFTVLCIVFCLIGRVANIFPLSYLANLWRHKQVPLKMQAVMWFAGLRGAISFALSQNMPGEHKDMFISTTLCIVIFTTIVCGGLTEPMLKKMEMRGAVDTAEPSGYAGSSVHNSPGSTTSMMTDGGNSLSSHGSQDGLELVTKRKNSRTKASASSMATSANPLHERSTSPIGIESGHSYEQVSANDVDSPHPLDAGDGGRVRSGSNVLSFIQKFDLEYMVPLFGGPSNVHDNAEDDTDLHYSPS